MFVEMNKLTVVLVNMIVGFLGVWLQRPELVLLPIFNLIAFKILTEKDEETNPT